MSKGRETMLAAPTIHSNGTSRDELLRQMCDATDALHRAIEVLASAGPNGRDYYPQGPDAIKRATAEHQDRLSRLQSVQAELQELAVVIAD